MIDATTSAPVIAAAVRAGKTRAREVVAGALERIAQRDRTLNAFTAVLREAALADAEAIDRRLAAGEDPGPDRRSTPTGRPPRATPPPSPGCARPAPCWSTRATPRAWPVAPPAARRRRWPAASCRSRSAPTRTARSAYRPRSAACSDSSRRSGASRARAWCRWRGRSITSDRSRATWPASPPRSTRWPAPTRAIPHARRSRRRAARMRSPAASTACASRSPADTSRDSPPTRRSRRSRAWPLHWARATKSACPRRTALARPRR